MRIRERLTDRDFVRGWRAGDLLRGGLENGGGGAEMTDRGDVDGREADGGNGGGRQVEVDVLIVGGGLAGQTLARQLLLQSDKRVLLIDRKELPPKRQKVGEATVQVSGYYYS